MFTVITLSPRSFHRMRGFVKAAQVRQPTSKRSKERDRLLLDRAPLTFTSYQTEDATNASRTLGIVVLDSRFIFNATP